MAFNSAGQSARKCAGALLLALLFTGVSPAGSARAEEPKTAAPVSYELPPLTDTKDVVPAARLESKNFKISEDVSIADFYYRFHLDAGTFGTFDVDSLDLLLVRTFETEVLSNAPEIKGADEFGKAAKSDLSATAKAAAKTVVTPVKSAKAFASGVEDTSRAVFDFIRLKKRNQPKDSFFTGEEKRKQAVKLGLDAYSTNPAVQDYLEALAKSRAPGSNLVNVGVSVTTFVIPFSTPISLAISAGKYREKMADKLAALSPMELYRYNDKILKKMDVPSSERELFLEYAGLTPRQKTEMIADLVTLDALADKLAFLHACIEPHPVEGIWQMQCADMLAKYNKTVVQIQFISSSGPVLSATSTDGRQLILLPSDIVYWSAECAKIFDKSTPTAQANQPAAREFIVSGRVTARAKEEIEKRGFTIRENFLSEEKQP